MEKSVQRQDAQSLKYAADSFSVLGSKASKGRLLDRCSGHDIAESN